MIEKELFKYALVKEWLLMYDIYKKEKNIAGHIGCEVPWLFSES